MPSDESNPLKSVLQEHERVGRDFLGLYGMSMVQQVAKRSKSHARAPTHTHIEGTRESSHLGHQPTHPCTGGPNARHLTVTNRALVVSFKAPIVRCKLKLIQCPQCDVFCRGPNPHRIRLMDGIGAYASLMPLLPTGPTAGNDDMIFPQCMIRCCHTC
jgi:hypothetical protein